VVHLKHALASDVVPMLLRLLDNGAASGGAPPQAKLMRRSKPP
jgi:hypothetical protein